MVQEKYALRVILTIGVLAVSDAALHDGHPLLWAAPQAAIPPGTSRTKSRLSPLAEELANSVPRRPPHGDFTCGEGPLGRVPPVHCVCARRLKTAGRLVAVSTLGTALPSDADSVGWRATFVAPEAKKPRVHTLPLWGLGKRVASNVKTVLADAGLSYKCL